MIVELRRGFKDHLIRKEYLPKGTLSYILESVKDLYNYRPFREALARKAAYLMYRFITQHPFLDGNKRTGYAAAYAFLRLNGGSLEVDPSQAFNFVIAIAEGKVSEEDAVRWVSKRLRIIE